MQLSFCGICTFGSPGGRWLAVSLHTHRTCSAGLHTPRVQQLQRQQHAAAALAAHCLRILWMSSFCILSKLSHRALCWQSAGHVLRAACGHRQKSCCLCSAALMVLVAIMEPDVATSLPKVGTTCFWWTVASLECGFLQ